MCREIDLLDNIKHDAIVELMEYYVCPSGAKIHLVMGLLEGGDLKEFMINRCGCGGYDAD